MNQIESHISHQCRETDSHQPSLSEPNSMPHPSMSVDVDDIVDCVFGIEASDRQSQHIDSTFQLDSDSESYLSDSEGNGQFAL